MRIFIASSDSMLRLALLLLLESEPGMAVIGVSDRSEGLLTAVEASQSEVLLLDYELVRPAAVDFIYNVHHLDCSPKIIILAIDPDVEAAIQAAGADGFISKNFPPDTLLPLLKKFRTSEQSQ